jgi:hypothetical protein
MLYAAKIAAAELYAPEHLRAAIIAALRAEQRAALRALREAEQIRINHQRQNRMGWQFAKRTSSARRTAPDPNRPQGRRRIRRRDKLPT